MRLKLKMSVVAALSVAALTTPYSKEDRSQWRVSLTSNYFLEGRDPHALHPLMKDIYQGFDNLVSYADDIDNIGTQVGAKLAVGVGYIFVGLCNYVANHEYGHGSRDFASGLRPVYYGGSDKGDDYSQSIFPYYGRLAKRFITFRAGYNSNPATGYKLKTSDNQDWASYDQNMRFFSKKGKITEAIANSHLRAGNLLEIIHEENRDLAYLEPQIKSSPAFYNDIFDGIGFDYAKASSIPGVATLSGTDLVTAFIKDQPHLRTVIEARLISSAAGINNSTDFAKSVFDDNWLHGGHKKMTYAAALLHKLDGVFYSLGRNKKRAGHDIQNVESYYAMLGYQLSDSTLAASFGLTYLASASLWAPLVNWGSTHKETLTYKGIRLPDFYFYNTTKGPSYKMVSGYTFNDNWFMPLEVEVAPYHGTLNEQIDFEITAGLHKKFPHIKGWAQVDVTAGNNGVMGQIKAAASFNTPFEVFGTLKLANYETLRGERETNIYKYDSKYSFWANVGVTARF